MTFFQGVLVCFTYFRFDAFVFPGFTVAWFQGDVVYLLLFPFGCGLFFLGSRCRGFKMVWFIFLVSVFSVVCFFRAHGVVLSRWCGPCGLFLFPFRCGLFFVGSRSRGFKMVWFVFLVSVLVSFVFPGLTVSCFQGGVDRVVCFCFHFVFFFFCRNNLVRELSPLVRTSARLGCLHRFWIILSCDLVRAQYRVPCSESSSIDEPAPSPCPGPLFEHLLEG